MRGVAAYSERLPRRQTVRLLGAVAMIALAGALGGCSTLGLPFGAELADTQAVGSISVNATLTDSVNPSDWEAVRRTVAAVPASQSKTVAWTNPRTGSSGTAIAIAGAAGATCRPFATTVSDPRGVRRYSGQLCRSSEGQWQVKSVAADDAFFS